jgi:Protein of unknown function (DUF3644)
VARPKRYRHFLDCAKDHALKACDFYNQRRREHNLESFVIHMSLAWLNLLQAMNDRDGVDMRYRNSVTGRIEKTDGEPKVWELSRCIRERIPSERDPIRANLEFFLRFRNKIEHRYDAKAMAALDLIVAGKAQSYIRNFEEMLVAEFGAVESLAKELRFPVFLSSLTPEAVAAIKAVRARAPRAVLSFIDKFDASLAGAADSPQYDFRVRLIPKTGPKTGSDLAVEFVNIKDLAPENRDVLESAFVVVRDKEKAIANYGRLKPGDVVKRVRATVPGFNQHHHRLAYLRFEVRPQGGSSDPAATDARYCVYDSVHKDYSYTEAWVEKVLRELRDDPGAALEEWKKIAARPTAPAPPPPRRMPPPPPSRNAPPPSDSS